MIVSLVILIFVLSIVFSWSNGFHHASAVAASPIASHSLERNQAVTVIFIFEFLGAMLGGSAVATVIQSLSSWPVEPSLLPLLASALLSAIIWNLVSNKIKVPASSTHALVGGMIGALFAGEGSFEHVRMGELDPLHPTGLVGAIMGLLMSPVLGFIAAYLLYSLMLLAFLKASAKAERWLRKVQWVATAGLAFGDGQNDTQKTMGLLVLALNASGLLGQDEIPIWVRGLTGAAMAAGVFWLSSGLAKEMAFRVYKLKPMHAAVAETAATSILVANSMIGAPVSASEVIAASIMGTGAAERAKGIHWLVIKDVLLSWIVTIPANALLAVVVHAVLFRWLPADL